MVGLDPAPEELLQLLEDEVRFDINCPPVRLLGGRAELAVNAVEVAYLEVDQVQPEGHPEPAGKDRAVYQVPRFTAGSSVAHLRLLPPYHRECPP
jgi:hypothetical protein